jgi:hypothetical protein
MLGVAGREGDPLVRDAGCRCQRQGDYDARGVAGDVVVLRGTTATAPAALHPLQQAWIDVQVPHCGTVRTA